MSLRITGGELRGRKITSPRSQSTRPTSARVREAVFNQLLHRFSLRKDWSINTFRTVDVFAGSGIMGFEIISRTKTHVTFVEIDQTASQAIKHNANLLGVVHRTSVLNIDAKNIARARAPCSVAFLDPPYHKNQSASSLCNLAQQGWLQKAAIVVVETSRDERYHLPVGFNLLDSRNYGSTKITFLEWLAE